MILLCNFISVILKDKHVVWNIEAQNKLLQVLRNISPLAETHKGKLVLVEIVV